MKPIELEVLDISRQQVTSPAWADLTGFFASIGCAIHCAAMPMVIGYLPALGLGWLATQGFHQAMAVICGGVAIAAFVPAWRRHKSFRPGLLGIIGVSLITGHAFWGSDCCASEAATCSAEACELCLESTPQVASFLPRLVTPLGGVFLICAHLLNHRLACLCCRGEQPCSEE